MKQWTNRKHYCRWGKWLPSEKCCQSIFLDCFSILAGQCDIIDFCGQDNNRFGCSAEQSNNWTHISIPSVSEKEQLLRPGLVSSLLLPDLLQWQMDCFQRPSHTLSLCFCRYHGPCVSLIWLLGIQVFWYLFFLNTTSIICNRLWSCFPLLSRRICISGSATGIWNDLPLHSHQWDANCQLN